jgi:hypothetical protein
MKEQFLFPPNLPKKAQYQSELNKLAKVKYTTPFDLLNDVEGVINRIEVIIDDEDKWRMKNRRRNLYYAIFYVLQNDQKPFREYYQTHF